VRSVEAALVAALLAALVVWTLHPLLEDPTGTLLGDADTDAIRGMWGMDHLRRSILPPDTPIWSKQVNFPHGVLALVLPWTSGVLLAPLGLLFGPVAGYNLGMAVILWAGAMATAWLVRTTSGSWAAGAALGAGMISQPMLLHSVADGTPEHVALWGIPAFLAATHEAIRRKNPTWGLVAGVLAFAVAMDSPYHAIYTAVIGALVLPVALWRHWEPSRRSDLLMTLGALLLAAGIGAGAMIGLFRNFPLEETVGLDRDALRNMNAADLHTWWQFDFGPAGERDPSLAPTLIPTIALWVGLGLGVLGVPRSLPWLLAALLMLCMSFGLNKLLPAELAQWMGGTGYNMGGWILRINAWLYDLPGLTELRFPRRWLVPTAMSVGVGAGYGAQRLFALLRRLRADRVGIPLLAVAGAIASVQAGIGSARLHTIFPMQTLPEVTFTDWIAEQEDTGALVCIPQVRPAPRSGKRGDLPVFASISQTLSSADVQYLQVLHGQPTVSYPTLKTLVPMRFDADVYRLMRNWDDLTHPAATGNPIPRSAYDERSEPARQATVARLRASGLRYVVVDSAAFGEEGLAILDAQLEPHTERIEEFEDGTGVRIYVLRKE
jgi:hypothetical protein